MKFKIGDKVKIISTIYTGETGEVVMTKGTPRRASPVFYDVRVKFDNPFRGTCLFYSREIKLHIPIGYQYLLFKEESD